MLQYVRSVHGSQDCRGIRVVLGQTQQNKTKQKHKTHDAYEKTDLTSSRVIMKFLATYFSM